MKVLKKVLGLLVVVTLLITNFSGVQASEEALSKAKQYYQQLEDKNIEYADQILAIEAIGIEVEDRNNGFIITEFLETDFATLQAGALGKAIIALSLVDKDPRAINGVDLVALLESYYQEDGSFNNKNTGDWVTVGTVPFDVIALKIVGSTLDMSKTITYFTSQQDTSGAFGYQSNGFHIEYASTAWAMLALDYLGATQASEKAKAFLDSSVDSTLHGWNQYGTLDANNQASVLWPLYELGYTEYSQEYQALLSFQCKNGSFGYKDNIDPNPMATQQAMLAVGVKHNGSIIDKAIVEYTETITPPKQEETISSDNGVVEVTGIFPVGTKINVETVKETNSIKDILVNTLKVDVKQLAILDISLVDKAGNDLSIEKAVSVKVKLPSGFSNTTIVYHQEQNGNIVNVPVTIENGYATFQTNSFSQFIFVEKNSDNANQDVVKPETKEPENVKTVDSTQVIAMAITMVISIFMIILLVEKKKKI